MDTNNTRNEGRENVDESNGDDTVHTVSFRTERQGLSLERIREYALSRGGKRIGIIAGAVVLMLGVLGIVSAGSLPGQPLYTVKTDIFENAGGIFMWTKEARAGYQLGLMEARLSESKKLAEAGEMSESVQGTLLGELTKNAERFSALTEASEERTLDREVVMDLGNRFASVLEAMEEIAESKGYTTEFSDAVADLRRGALRRLRDEIEVYVSLTDDESLRELLTREFSMISEEVGSDGVSEDTQARIGRIVDDIKEAIAADDATDALEAAYEARRLMKVENYLK